MNILIVGLGLIGGSLAKALTTNTSHNITGFDIDKKTVSDALKCGAIHSPADSNSIKTADITIVCLYPRQIVEFIKLHAKDFKKGSIVTDACGIKSYIYMNVFKTALENGFEFVGSHPMAGKEVGGFENSDASLFNNASYIIAGNEDSPSADVLKELALNAGFGKIVITSPEEHDTMIAYTSQIPHVLACAYILNPCSKKHDGFSAGSFRDVSRVAKINEAMWSELFELNSPHLLHELENLIQNLGMLHDLLATHNESGLKAILAEGRKLKEYVAP